MRRYGAAAFAELAAGAKPLVEYMLIRNVGRHDLSTIEGQTAAVASSLPVLEGLGDPVRRAEYAHLLAELTGVSEASVVLALERKLAGRPTEVGQAIRRSSVHEKVEREMLRLLARDADLYAAFAPRLSERHFQLANTRKLFAMLTGAGGDVRSLVATSDDEKVVRAASALALEPLDGEPSGEYAEEVWSRLQEFALKRSSAELRQRLQKLNPTTEPEAYDHLFQELIAVDGELRRLKERHGVHA
jgi:DNA primase